MRIRFDEEKCTGCMACQMACIDQRDVNPLENPIRYVATVEDKGAIHFRSIGCVHCGKCMNVCPQRAMERDAQGFIQLIQGRCVGCGNCAAVCPFHVITRISSGKMMKCDGCAERLKAGLLPACVHTCPTGALYVE